MKSKNVSGGSDQAESVSELTLIFIDRDDHISNHKHLGMSYPQLWTTHGALSSCGLVFQAGTS